MTSAATDAELRARRHSFRAAVARDFEIAYHRSRDGRLAWMKPLQVVSPCGEYHVICYGDEKDVRKMRVLVRLPRDVPIHRLWRAAQAVAAARADKWYC